MYDTENMLDRVGHSTPARLVSIATAMALSYGISAPAAAQEPKQPAPLEQRLTEVPKQAPPKVEYSPVIPGPLTTQRMSIEKIPVLGMNYDENDGLYTGTAVLGDYQVTLKLFVGRKETDEQKVFIETADKELIGNTVFKSGIGRYLSPEDKVSVIPIVLPQTMGSSAGNNYLVFNYVKEKGVIEVIGAYITKGEKIYFPVREGPHLVGLNMVSDKVACRGIEECITIPRATSKKALAVRERQVKDFCEAAQKEAEKMMSLGVPKDRVLSYVRESRQRLEAELNLDQMYAVEESGREEDLDVVPLIPLVKGARESDDITLSAFDEKAATFFDKTLVSIADTHYAPPEDVQETPAPVAVAPLVKVAEPVKVPEPVKVAEPVKVQEPVKVPGPVQMPKPTDFVGPMPEEPKYIPSPPVVKKLDLSPKPQPLDDIIKQGAMQVPVEAVKDESPEWYQSWWFWTITSVAVAGTAVGLGVYYGTRDGGSVEPQPPVGIPTTDPWDGHDNGN